jgi:hypothetical protein
MVWNGTAWQTVESSNVSSTSPIENDSKLERYRQAMTIAMQPATKVKGKDVLGPASPWKLNLYDDNNDGQWDRGKLDYDRDEVDDEKWTFKQGRWEANREGKVFEWSGSAWMAR